MRVLWISLSADVPSENLLPPAKILFQVICEKETAHLHCNKFLSTTITFRKERTNGINFIHEDYAGLVISRVTKHLSDQPGTLTDVFVNDCTWYNLVLRWTAHSISWPVPNFRFITVWWILVILVKTAKRKCTFKKLQSSCEATARARRVLPVPGGPYSKHPLGGVIPTRWNNSGFRSGSSMTWTESCHKFQLHFYSILVLIGITVRQSKFHSFLTSLSSLICSPNPPICE